jgi:hypothetical protein
MSFAEAAGFLSRTEEEVRVPSKLLTSTKTRARLCRKQAATRKESDNRFRKELTARVSVLWLRSWKFPRGDCRRFVVRPSGEGRLNIEAIRGIPLPPRG